MELTLIRLRRGILYVMLPPELPHIPIMADRLLISLIATARGEAKGYRITDVNKLHEVAKVFDVSTEGRETNEIAEEVGEMALAEFGKAYGTQSLRLRPRKPE